MKLIYNAPAKASLEDFYEKGDHKYPYVSSFTTLLM